MGIAKICFSIWVHNVMYVLHFGFLFNDECLQNSKLSWCRNLSYFLQSWEGFQNPIPFMSKTPPSPLFQTRTWCGLGLGYTMEGKIKWPFNLLMFYVFASWNSWKVNEGIWTPLWNGIFIKNFPNQINVKQPTIKNHLGHMW